MYELIKALVDQAEQTGETQTVSLDSDGWQDIIKNGKKVGRYRLSMAQITITAEKKKSKRKPVATPRRRTRKGSK